MKKALWGALFILICLSPAPARSQTISITHHGTTISPCAQGTPTCAASLQPIAATGDLIHVTLQFCWDGSCVTANPSCTITVTDGTNTYSQVTAAALEPTSTYPYLTFEAPNAVAGTYTVTFTISGCVYTWFYPVFNYAVFHQTGGSGTPSLDTAVTHTASGTSATPSVASAGNVTRSGEMAYSFISGGSTLAVTGSYSTLDSLFSNCLTVNLAGPSSGSTTTASFSQTSGSFLGYIIAIKPGGSSSVSHAPPIMN